MIKTSVTTNTTLNHTQEIQMIKFLKVIRNSVNYFSKHEEGAQVVEYALIIAVVSITLVVALRDLIGTNFSGFITRVTNCLTGGACITPAA